MCKSIDEIKENLTFAAQIMRRLPTVRVRGYFCTWPNFKPEYGECFVSDTWLPPLPDEIEAMERILEWLKFTNVENRRIIWLRSCGMGWKHLTHHYKKSRSTITRAYLSGLKDIQNALNDEKSFTSPKVLSANGLRKFYDTK